MIGESPTFNIMLKQSGVAQLTLLLIVIAGIAIAVFLVQYTQVFKPKAYSDEELDAYCAARETLDKEEGNELTISADQQSGATSFFIDNDGNIKRELGGSTGFYITEDGSIRRSIDQSDPLPYSDDGTKGPTTEPDEQIDFESSEE